MSPTMVAGRLAGALEVLDGHYAVPVEEKIRHTINTGAPTAEAAAVMAK